MSNLKTILPKTEPALVAESPKEVAEDPRQRRLMVGALCLLLLALGIVLWHDRNFWFPDTEEAESEQPVESVPAAKTAPVQESRIAQPAPVAKLKPKVPLKTKEDAPANA